MKHRAIRLSSYLRDQNRKFDRLAREVHRKIDPESLHQLRVLTRRLRAVVWISRHARRGPGLGNLRKALRKLGHALGDRRTLDVMFADAARYGLDSSKLENDSRRAGNRVKSMLCKKERKQFQTLLRDAETRLREIRSEDLVESMAELIARLAELKQAHPRTVKEWHRIRIEAKKIRYASEVLGLKVPELKDLQDVLGHGHDLKILSETLGRRPHIASEERLQWRKAGKLMLETLRKTEHRLLRLRGRRIS